MYGFQRNPPNLSKVQRLLHWWSLRLDTSVCNQGNPHEAQWHENVIGSGKGGGMAERKTAALGSRDKDSVKWDLFPTNANK